MKASGAPGRGQRHRADEKGVNAGPVSTLRATLAQESRQRPGAQIPRLVEQGIQLRVKCKRRLDADLYVLP